jgi:hypothetical protein
MFGPTEMVTPHRATFRALINNVIPPERGHDIVTLAYLLIIIIDM